jgi:AcrR family transcriptional regulator
MNMEKEKACIPVVPVALDGPKGRIVAAALELFAQSGYDGVSVRDIAKAVGIKDASIYSHFASKEEILETIVERFRASFVGSNPDVADFDKIFSVCTPRVFLTKGFDLFKRRLQDPPTAWSYLVLMREKFSGGRAAEVWAAHRTTVIHYVSDAFAAMIRLGLIPKRDPVKLARLYEYPIFLLIEDYVLRLCRHESTSAIEREIRSQVDFVIDFIEK